VELACALEVVAHIFGHVVGQHGASDRGSLELGGVLGLQTTTEPEAVEGQRRLVGRLELTEDGGAMRLHRCIESGRRVASAS
jgi:hypothetical protein